MKKVLGLASTLALAIAGVASSMPVSQAASVEQRVEVSDDTWGSLVEDWESPSAVAERASKSLGDRFVDVRVSDDHRHFIVGVLNLKEDEAAGLEKQLTGDAPVTVEARSVSLADVNAARQTVEKAVLASGMPFTMISANPQLGVVNLQVPTSKQTDEAVSLVTGALPGAQSVAPVGDDAGADVAADMAGPSVTVEIRVVDGGGAFT